MQQMMTVETFVSPWHAHMARGLLESEGIHAILANEHHVWACWQISHALGGVRLQVPAEQFAQARTVLQAMADGEYEQALLTEAEAAGGAQDECCPHCGSSEVDYVCIRRHPFISFFATFLFGVLTPLREWKYKCRQCGKFLRVKNE